MVTVARLVQGQDLLREILGWGLVYNIVVKIRLLARLMVSRKDCIIVHIGLATW